MEHGNILLTGAEKAELNILVFDSTTARLAETYLAPWKGRS